jgi:hypothetical protein
MRLCGGLVKGWWSRERVLAGLRRFYREQGVAPTATDDYHAMVRTQAKGPRRRYPSAQAVLSHFRTFRDAWEAVGIVTNRYWEEWSAVEDWYIREAIGFLGRTEIAADLRRSPDAVHRRVYDLGLDTRTAHGWSPNRVFCACRNAGITEWAIHQYIKKGILPARRGTTCMYIDPADLVVMREIDWERASVDLRVTVRNALLGRLAGVLAGKLL